MSMAHTSDCETYGGGSQSCGIPPLFPPASPAGIQVFLWWYSLTSLFHQSVRNRWYGASWSAVVCKWKLNAWYHMGTWDLTFGYHKIKYSEKVCKYIFLLYLLISCMYRPLFVLAKSFSSQEGSIRYLAYRIPTFTFCRRIFKILWIIPPTDACL